MTNHTAGSQVSEDCARCQVVNMMLALDVMLDT